jgi:deoxyribodipyrimidine photo-lyase
MPAPVIVWFRHDLRLADNPALTAAAATGQPILALHVLDDAAAGPWRLGGAARWWLHHSLLSLASALQRHGMELVLKRGEADRVLHDLVAATGTTTVFWNRRYEPWAIEQDRRIKAGLRERGIAARSCNGNLCVEPWEIRQASGEPYRIFTPFSRTWVERGPPPAPLPAPASLAAVEPGQGRAGLALDALELLPQRPDWASGLRESWEPGEPGAKRTLALFLDEGIAAYAGARDFPARPAVSRLSPHLRFGEISPRQVCRAARLRAEAGLAPAASVWAFVRQLVWREFAYHLLYHSPGLPEQPLRPAFARFPWRSDDAALAAWRQGRTGYPIVDAGMRELWRTGHMHNRVRMLVASFLTKDLLLPWQEGAAWFWDTLCDADLASNSMGWQWVAGCGTDAAPYVRMFNPLTQARKFDPDGAYTRRWVPELARLPDAWLHEPAAAPAAILASAGVTLGETYPRPIVDHAAARERALMAFEQVRLSG